MVGDPKRRRPSIVLGGEVDSITPRVKFELSWRDAIDTAKWILKLEATWKPVKKPAGKKRQRT
jgi:hypothetical protein